MLRKIFLPVILISVIVSCNNNASIDSGKPENEFITQKDDGTISLNVKKADCYANVKDPSENTAEWNVKILKSGRYHVWISSATRDTTTLNYNNSVYVNFDETHIEGVPECDKIVYNSTDVSYPYFRADSFLGTVFIQDTGAYNVQVISEKILPEQQGSAMMSDDEISKLISVSLTPEIR
jgi:hypothetical protein